MEILWFIIIAASVAFYVVLDGFDLGVGILHLFAKGDKERRICLNAIGPVWDGNEVWLVIIMGALFAGFPGAYATICSTFYNLIMVLLFGIIFRAVAIEFRSKVEGKKWRSCWDVAFSVASIIITFAIGFLLANLIEGVPLNAEGDFIGTSAEFISPYSICLGLTSLALFAMHGAIFLLMKTEGNLHARMRRIVPKAIGIFILTYLVTTGMTFTFAQQMIEPLRKNPSLFLVGLAAFIAIISIGKVIKKGRDGWAFAISCASILLLIALFALGTFPILVRSTIDPDVLSITIYNSASSPKTMKVLLTIAGIGVPLVVAYGFWIYHIFRGKVELDTHSY